MLAIKNNIMAENAARHLGQSYDALATSVERLSSGLRINSAKDDAAGLAVRELIRADVAVLQQGARNAQDGISMLQTMEGAMAVIDENLIRMNELAEQAATGSYSAEQREIMNYEFAEMADEIERIANNTKFNDISLLSASGDTVKIHVGTTETIDVTTVDMTKSGLEINTGVEVEQAIFKSLMANTGTDAFITTSDNDSLTMEIEFANGATPEDAVTIALAADTPYTLAQIVGLINDESNALGYAPDGTNKNYDMASILENDDGTYSLSLESRDEGDGVTITLYSDSGNTGDVTFGGTGGTAITDVLQAGTALADGTDYDADPVEGGLNILTADDAEAALATLKDAITTKDQARAAFGYKMNRLESTVSIVEIQAENLMAAESRISDVDVATEMAKMTRNQVLSQAGISMLSQANLMPQMALNLLR
jgi:flagellin